MRKKAFPSLLLVVLSSLIPLSGCSGGPAGGTASAPPSSAASAGQTGSGKPYQFDRGDFLARYQEALDRLASGTQPVESAPEDPAETGFAVVPLEEEIYGVSRFAFLPLSWRDLTGEELLSLAAGMDGLPAKDLLQPAHSRTGLQDGGEELLLLQQNRELSPDETGRRAFLEPGYLYEGNRLESDPREGPKVLRLSAEEGKTYFALLPRAELSDDGLLRYLDAVYGNMPERYWIPLEGELAYEELPGVLKEAATRFLPGKDAQLPPYLALLTPMYDFPKEPRDTARDYWVATLLYPSGSQYVLSLRADTGELISWVRYPEGFYTGAASPASSAASSGAVCTEEELERSAAAYAAKAFPENGVLSLSAEEKDVPSLYFGPCRRFTLELEDGASLQLTLAKQDASPCALTRFLS